MLRAASMLVPSVQRAEWVREWRGELWHARQACAEAGAISWRSERELTAFCLGAFQDASCLRQAARGAKPHAGGMEGSRRQCLLILGGLLAASYAIGLLLPGVRAERSLWPRAVNPNLVLIQQGQGDNGSWPTITPRLFRSWAAQRQKFFDGFAFYRVTRENVTPATGTMAGPARWGVARASSNLFSLLGLRVEFGNGDAPAGDLPGLILSERLWKRQFGADQHVAGATVLLGGRTVRIAGVAPDGSLGLPGMVDAWLLEPAPEAESARTGYVVAHLTAAGQSMMWAQNVHISASDSGDPEEDFLGIALEEWKPATRNLYLFALMLALLALPAITTVSLGEYSVNPHKTSWTLRMARWSFLCGKIGLLLPIVYFVSLDLAYGSTSMGREGSAYIELVSTFALCLFGLRWVLKDQRQRCPVCMRRVTHPAQVGLASRTFLDWNGTEMICMGGHTLLHVPSLPTSWFGSQRWLYLDNSWGFLFAGSEGPMP
jgi:hypothetical protein